MDDAVAIRVALGKVLRAMRNRLLDVFTLRLVVATADHTTGA